MAVENDHLFNRPPKEEIEDSLKQFVIEQIFVERENPYESYSKHPIRFYRDDAILFQFEVDSGRYELKRRYRTDDKYKMTQEIEKSLAALLFLNGFDYFRVCDTWSGRRSLLSISGLNENRYNEWLESKEKGSN